MSEHEVVAGRGGCCLLRDRLRACSGALRDVAPRALHRERLLDPGLRPSSALICEYGSVFDQGPMDQAVEAEEVADDSFGAF